jgi:ribosomal-protein-alanine N-acetyltransferase
MIRPAVIDDLNSIVRIEHSSFLSDYFSARQIKYLLSQAQSFNLVYVNPQNQVIGYIIALFRKNCRHLRIYSVAVDSHYQGSGIARHLFTELEKFAQKKFWDLSLEVRSDRPNLIAIYEKLGYQKLSIKPNYYSDGTDAFKMRKYIK